jgi:hypothetical protein
MQHHPPPTGTKPPGALPTQAQAPARQAAQEPRKRAPRYPPSSKALRAAYGRLASWDRVLGEYQVRYLTAVK